MAKKIKLRPHKASLKNNIENGVQIKKTKHSNGFTNEEFDKE
jgi:hypothetical protein